MGPRTGIITGNYTISTNAKDNIEYALADAQQTWL
jgi:hypothetical protein